MSKKGAFGIQKFEYVTSNLPAVVNDESLELISRSFFEGKTSTKFRFQTGIKSTDDLHYMETELYYQADSGCEFTASGATSFSKRTISVASLKVQQSFCAKKLEGFWTEKALRAGSNYDYIAFETDWKNYLVGLMTETREKALWQSNTSTGTGNFNKYDGFIKVIDDASALTIVGNTGGITSGTGITTSNVIAIIDAMWQACPATLKGKPDLEFMMGMEVFDKLIVALKNANLYHYDGVNGSPYQSGVIIVPGTGIKAELYNGLNSTNRIFLARTSNFFIGTDLEGDSEDFDIRENPIDKNMLVDIHWKEGVQIALPQEIVQFKLA